MQRRGGRSLFLLACLLAFCCLMAAGGRRLIGCEQPSDRETSASPALQAAFTAAPAPDAQESGEPEPGERSAQRLSPVIVSGRMLLRTAVCSDANGNVLGGRTYLRAVYRAFSLGDGFV